MAKTWRIWQFGKSLATYVVTAGEIIRYTRQMWFSPYSASARRPTLLARR
ncbi:MAG: hypothetical protein ACSLEL_01635 [Candidatus Malihini olakiniferum]